MFGYQAERRRVSKLMGVDYLWFGLFGQIMGVLLIGAGPPEPARCAECWLGSLPWSFPPAF